jgi:dienelactone hydrolase
MTDINVETPNGSIDAVLEIPSGEGPWPGVVVIHDAFGSPTTVTWRWHPTSSRAAA